MQSQKNQSEFVITDSNVTDFIKQLEYECEKLNNEISQNDKQVKKSKKIKLPKQKEIQNPIEVLESESIITISSANESYESEPKIKQKKTKKTKQYNYEDVIPKSEIIYEEETYIPKPKKHSKSKHKLDPELVIAIQKKYDDLKQLFEYNNFIDLIYKKSDLEIIDKLILNIDKIPLEAIKSISSKFKIISNNILDAKESINNNTNLIISVLESIVKKIQKNKLKGPVDFTVDLDVIKQLQETNTNDADSLILIFELIEFIINNPSRNNEKIRETIIEKIKGLARNILANGHTKINIYKIAADAVLEIASKVNDLTL